MNFRLLGKSGLRVSELCLGTMTFGEELGWGASKEESRKIFDAYVEKGGNFIDTANLYTKGTSERFCGEFISGERDHFVLATKYTFSIRENDPNAGGNHRKCMVQSLEGSLKRLKVDYIDLYWVHAWDFMTPAEEVMRALDDMVRAGKVLYIGSSDTPAWVVSQSNTMAELRGWTQYIALQIEYSLIERTSERELVPMARDYDLGLTAWSPLASGLLTGKYREREREEGQKRLDIAPFVKSDVRTDSIVDEVLSVSEELGRTPSQVALNWVRQRGFIPILGARKESQITDNLGCLDFAIPEDLMKKLDEASRTDLGFPHEFLARPHLRRFMYGGTYDLIENKREIEEVACEAEKAAQYAGAGLCV